jgi:hypothetical protein
VENDKHKKLVEQSVLVSIIHDRMDSKNADYFKFTFIHRNLYMVFVRQNFSGFRSAKEFEQKFQEILKVDQSINRLNPEYQRKLDIE